MLLSVCASGTKHINAVRIIDMSGNSDSEEKKSHGISRSWYIVLTVICHYVLMQSALLIRGRCSQCSYKLAGETDDKNQNTWQQRYYNSSSD